MPKYAVRLKGTGCLVKVQDVGGFLRKPRIQCRDFLTTRFVEESSAQEAVQKAADLVREELKEVLSNGPQDPWTLSAEEVWEDPQQFDRYAPGSGCTWFESAPQ
jgi:hypothetical protein